MNISVCGDDGTLYENYCALLRSQCEKNRYINVIDYGTCPARMRKNFLVKKFKIFDPYNKFRPY
jgi:hypothetical protein